MKINRILAVFAALVGPFGLWGCVQANNPYDLEAPDYLQLDGRVIGRIVLDGHNFDEQPVRLQVLDQSETPVQNEDGPIIIETRTSESEMPSGFNDDDRGPAGTFAVKLPPSEAPYILRFDAAENSLALFENTEKMIWVFPDATVQIELQPSAKGQEAYTGTVTVEVNGTEPGNSFNVSLEPQSDTAGAQTQTQLGDGDGNFTFEGVLPGAVYQIKVSGDAYLPITSALFVVPSPNAGLASVDEVDWNPCEGSLCDVGTLKMATLGQIFEIDFDTLNQEDGSIAPYTRRTQIPVKLAVNQLFLDAENGLSYELYMKGQSEWASENSEDDANDYVAVDTTAVNQETSVTVDLLEGRDSIVDGQHALIVQLKVCPLGLDVCYESGRARVEVVLDRASPLSNGITVEGLPEEAELTINCARFSETQCPPPAGSSLFVPTVEGMLYDRHSPIVGYAFSKNNDTATAACPETFVTGNVLCPSDFLVLDSESGTTFLPTSNGPSFSAEELLESENSRPTLQVWAKDAAGNIGLVHQHQAAVDLLPVDAEAIALNLSPLVNGSVDGLERSLVTQELLSASIEPGDVTEDIYWRVSKSSGASVGMNERRLQSEPANLVLNGIHRETVELELQIWDSADNRSAKTLPPVVIWKKGNVSGTLSLANGESPETATLQLSNAETSISTTANSEGAFTFEEVSAGAWQFQANAQALETVFLPSISVEAAKETQLGTVELADNTAPVFELSLNDGSGLSASAEVVINLTDMSDDVAYLWISEAEFTSASTNAAVESRDLPFADGDNVFALTDYDGVRTVYVRVFDKAGNFTEDHASILLDRNGPTNVQITCSSCNDPGTGSLYANDANLIVSVSADDKLSGYTDYTLQICDPEGACEPPSDAFAASTTTTLVLEAGTENAIIKAVALDEAGNESDPQEISVTLANTSPEFAVVLDGVAAGTVHTSEAFIQMKIHGTEDAANTGKPPLVAYKVASADVIGVTAWEDFPIPLNAGQGSTSFFELADYLPDYQNDGEKVLAIFVKDAAGNEASVERTVVLDREAPILTSVSSAEKDLTQTPVYLNAEELSAGKIQLDLVATDSFTHAEDLRYLVTADASPRDCRALMNTEDVSVSFLTGFTDAASITFCNRTYAANAEAAECDLEDDFAPSGLKQVQVLVADAANNCSSQVLEITFDQIAPRGRKLHVQGRRGRTGQSIFATNVAEAGADLCPNSGTPLTTLDRSLDVWWKGANGNTLGRSNGWDAVRMVEVTTGELAGASENLETLFGDSEWKALEPHTTVYLEGDECATGPCITLLAQARDAAGNTTDVFCVPVRLDETEPNQPTVLETRALDDNGTFVTSEDLGDAALVQITLSTPTYDPSFDRYTVISERVAGVTAAPVPGMTVPTCESTYEEAFDPACDDCGLDSTVCVQTNADNGIFLRRLKSDFRNIIRIYARDVAGNISQESLVVFEEDSTAPTRPTGVQTEETTNSVHVSWSPSASPDVAYYRVHYGTMSRNILGGYSGTNASNGESPISVGKDTDLTLFGIPNGARVYFAVTAVDQAGNESAFSPEVSGVPSDFAPKLLSQVGGTTSELFRHPTKPFVLVPEDNGLAVYHITEEAGAEKAVLTDSLENLPDVVQVVFAHDLLYVHCADPVNGPVRAKSDAIFPGLPNENAPVRSMVSFADLHTSNPESVRYVKQGKADLPDDTAFIYFNQNYTQAVSGTLGVRIEEGSEIPKMKTKSSVLTTWGLRNGAWQLTDQQDLGRAISGWQQLGSERILSYSYALPENVTGENSFWPLAKFLALPVRLSIWSFGEESDQPNGTIIEEELAHNTNPLSDGLIIPFGESTKIGNALFHLFPGLTAVSVLDLAQAENGDITGLNIYGELHAAALLGPNDDDTSHPFRNLDGSLQSLNGLSILPDPNAEANEETDGRSAHVILENANRSLLDLLTDKLEDETAVQSNLELYEQTLEQNFIANTLFLADFIERGHLDGAELILSEDEGSETSVTIVKAEIDGNQARLQLDTPIQVDESGTVANVNIDQSPQHRSLMLRKQRFDVRTIPNIAGIDSDDGSFLFVGTSDRLLSYPLTRDSSGHPQLGIGLQKALTDEEPSHMQTYLNAEGELRIWSATPDLLQHYDLNDFVGLLQPVQQPQGAHIPIDNHFGFLHASGGFVYASPRSKTKGSLSTIDVSFPSKPVTTSRVTLEGPVVQLTGQGSRIYALTNTCTGNANNDDNYTYEAGATGNCTSYGNSYDSYGIYRCGCEQQAHLTTFSITPTDPVTSALLDGAYAGRPTPVAQDAQPLNTPSGEKLNYVNGVVPWGSKLLAHRYAPQLEGAGDANFAEPELGILALNSLASDVAGVPIVPGSEIVSLWRSSEEDGVEQTANEQFAFARYGNYLFATVGIPAEYDPSRIENCIGVFKLTETNGAVSAQFLQHIQDSCADNNAILYMKAVDTLLFTVDADPDGLRIYDLTKFLFNPEGSILADEHHDGYTRGITGHLCYQGGGCEGDVSCTNGFCVNHDLGYASELGAKCDSKEQDICQDGSPCINNACANLSGLRRDSNIELVGNYNSGGPFMGGLLHGNHMYLMGHQALFALDIGTPSNPTLAYTFDVKAISAAAEGGYLYVATASNGMRIYDLMRRRTLRSGSSISSSDFQHQNSQVTHSKVLVLNHEGDMMCSDYEGAAERFLETWQWATGLPQQTDATAVYDLLPQETQEQLEPSEYFQQGGPYEDYLRLNYANHSDSFLSFNDNHMALQAYLRPDSHNVEQHNYAPEVPDNDSFSVEVAYNPLEVVLSEGETTVVSRLLAYEQAVSLDYQELDHDDFDELDPPAEELYRTVQAMPAQGGLHPGYRFPFDATPEGGFESCTPSDQESEDYDFDRGDCTNSWEVCVHHQQNPTGICVPMAPLLRDTQQGNENQIFSLGIDSQGRTPYGGPNVGIHVFEHNLPLRGFDYLNRDDRFADLLVGFDGESPSRPEHAELRSLLWHQGVLYAGGRGVSALTAVAHNLANEEDLAAGHRHLTYEHAYNTWSQGGDQTCIKQLEARGRFLYALGQTADSSESPCLTELYDKDNTVLLVYEIGYLSNDTCVTYAGRKATSDTASDGPCLVSRVHKHLPERMSQMALHGDAVYLTGTYEDSQVYIFDLWYPEGADDDYQLDLIGSTESSTTGNDSIKIFGSHIFIQNFSGITVLDGR